MSSLFDYRLLFAGLLLAPVNFFHGKTSYDVNMPLMNSVHIYLVICLLFSFMEHPMTALWVYSWRTFENGETVVKTIEAVSYMV